MNRLVGNLDNQLIIQLICQAKILTILCFLASQMRNCFFARSPSLLIMSNSGLQILVIAD